LDERAKFMARQGQAFATADEARIVHTDSGENLKDVPADGKTVGEIVVRGNIVMKEVRTGVIGVIGLDESSTLVFPRPRGYKENISRWPLLVW
jgi:acyl-CoA synthetase (AMP-forming)/AMP-acid ligase II